jgi:signal transduction histidine kinase
MLGNLLKNAVEASPPGGQITISRDKGEAAVVSIHNMGVIPESVSS